MSQEVADSAVFQAWRKAMRGEFDAFLQQTWADMASARQGHWIADTEEVMRSARDQLGQVAYEKLLQVRIEGSEASFSPSGRRRFVAEQGSAGGDASDGGGARAADPPRVVGGAGRNGVAGG